MKSNTQQYGINWDNINLKDGYERNLNMLDPYDFDTLLLEVNCNLREINRETVAAQFNEVLESKIATARSIFKSNLDNIIKNAIEYREND